MPSHYLAGGALILRASTLGSTLGSTPSRWIVLIHASCLVWLALQTDSARSRARWIGVTTYKLRATSHGVCHGPWHSVRHLTLGATPDTAGAWGLAAHCTVPMCSCVYVAVAVDVAIPCAARLTRCVPSAVPRVRSGRRVWPANRARGAQAQPASNDHVLRPRIIRASVRRAGAPAARAATVDHRRRVHWRRAFHLLRAILRRGLLPY